MAVPFEQFVQQLEDSGILAGETIKDFLPPRSPRKFNDFFEFTFKMENDLLTALADGKEVVRARDAEITGKGEMAFSPQKGRGLYKRADVRILD